jgi:4-alpha-glucanotransferase
MPLDLLNAPAAPHWKSIGIRHHHGINTPLFSLHTKESCGIGEFEDLKPLIDWLKPLGFDIIQLLPLYASGQDPSPYNALSANALNPIYISLHALPGLDQHPDLIAEMQRLKAPSKGDRILYLRIKKSKESILKTYVDREKQHLKLLPQYSQFLSENPWTLPFARFKAYKEIYGGKHWLEWPKAAAPLSQDQIDPHQLVQFLAYSQMQGVKAYADERGMFLMGDIPILISPDSADVWNQPGLFDLAHVAGCPPDMYNPEGQYWGFPLYNDQELENQNFRFWKERLACAERLYHLYRIDHIVGFFRIFSIPRDKKPKEGNFEPADASLWQKRGEKILRVMLESTSMLPIGEDLGVIPPITRQIMHRMGISGTKMMRWERNWEGDRSYIPFDKYPADSLTTLSTHDSEPLALWWDMQGEDVKAFAGFKGWGLTPHLLQDQQKEILWDSHHTGSLFHINLLQEYLGLIPELTWGNLAKERINLPGIVSPDNWSFRYKPSIEEMASHPKLSQELVECIS